MIRFARVYAQPPGARLLMALATLLASTAFVLPLCAQVPAAEVFTGDAQSREKVRRERELAVERDQRLTRQSASQAREANEMVGKLETKTSAFLSRLKELLTSDDGKRLSADTDAVRALVRMQEEPVATLEQIQAKKAVIASILETIDAELKRPPAGFLPGEKLKPEVDDVFYWARDRLVRVTQQDSWLTMAIGRAPKDVDLKKAKTLESRIRDFHAAELEALEIWRRKGEEQAKPESEKVWVETSRFMKIQQDKAEAERRARDALAQIETMKIEQDIKLKVQEEENQRRLSETEIRLKNALAEIERSKKMAAATRTASDVETDLAAKKVLDEAAKKKRMDQCRDPEVQRLLAPFLAEGYTQPNVEGLQPDKLPISYSKLVSCNALQPDRTGLIRLLTVATWTGDRVRPRWGYTPFFDKLEANQLEEIKKAQQYLRDLGPTMVELKMLAP